MTERTTTDTAELADLLVELARHTNAYADHCRYLAVARRGLDLHVANHYGWLAAQANEQAGRAIGWARQLRDSHAVIVGHWPRSDEGRARWEADCSGPEDQVTPFDVIDEDDIRLADKREPLLHAEGTRVHAEDFRDDLEAEAAFRDDTYEATWSDRDDDRDEEVRS